MQRKKQPKHGTISTYTNYKCRCSKCRAAVAAYQKGLRERNAETLKNGAA